MKPIKLSFDRCDVTKGVIGSFSLNKQLERSCGGTDLFVFCYVVNETSAKSCKEGLFWSHLALLARPGTLFLFLDIIVRSRAVFVKIQRFMGDILSKEQPECCIERYDM